MAIQLQGEPFVLAALARNVDQSLSQRNELATRLWRNYYYLEDSEPELILPSSMIETDPSVQEAMLEMEEELKARLVRMGQELDIPRDATTTLSVDRLFVKVDPATMSDEVSMALGDFWLRGDFHLTVTRSKTGDFVYDQVDVESINAEYRITEGSFQYGGHPLWIPYNADNPGHHYEFLFEGGSVLRLTTLAELLEANDLATPFLTTTIWHPMVEIDGFRVENPKVKKRCCRECVDETLTPCDFKVWAYPEQPPPPCPNHGDASIVPGCE